MQSFCSDDAIEPRRPAFLTDDPEEILRFEADAF